MSKITIRNIVIASILMLSAGAFLAAMVYQVLAQGDHLVLQIEAMEKERAQESSYLTLQRMFDKTTLNRENLRKYFLGQVSDSIDFVNKVETLAPSLGVSLETTGLASVSDKVDDSQWAQATFEIAGSKDDLLRFIKILETLPYISQVTSVEMEVLSRSDWKAEVIIKVRVLNYVK